MGSTRDHRSVGSVARAVGMVLVIAAASSCSLPLCCQPPLGTHSCTFDGGVVGDHSLFDMCLAVACPLPSLFGEPRGVVDITCGAVGPDGTASCTCAIQEVAPIYMLGVGYFCIEPAALACAAGKIDCNGGTALNAVQTADHTGAGICTSSADCKALCATHCAGQGLHVYRAECERFCEGGVNDGLPCDCDVIPAVTCTSGVTQCPGGSCAGRDEDPAPNYCHCECFDAAAAPANPPGSLQCQLPTTIRLETMPPCDDTGVLMRLPPRCALLTTASHTSTIAHANEGVGPPLIGPPTLTGAPFDCDALRGGSTASGMLVTNLSYFDTVVGDHLLSLVADCQ